MSPPAGVGIGTVEGEVNDDEEDTLVGNECALEPEFGECAMPAGSQLGVVCAYGTVKVAGFVGVRNAACIWEVGVGG